MSSDNLGSTIHTAQDSTTSVTGYDSASVVFHGDTTSNAQSNRQAGQSNSELTKDSEMEQDVTREQDTDMDTTHKDEYKMNDSSQSTAQPNHSNQSSIGTDRTAQLLQAQVEGTPADVTGTLRGAQANELAKIKLLAQIVFETANSNRPSRPHTAKTATDSNSGSNSSSGGESESANTEASTRWTLMGCPIGLWPWSTQQSVPSGRQIPVCHTGRRAIVLYSARPIYPWNLGRVCRAGRGGLVNPLSSLQAVHQAPYGAD